MNINDATKILLVSLLGFTASHSNGHELGATGTHTLDWHTPTVSRTVSASYSWNDLGVRALYAAGKVVDVDGQTCIRGQQFNFDIKDEYAFDIDETVILTLTIDLPGSGPELLVAYDRNGKLDYRHVELPDSDEATKEITLTLTRARFANRGDHATDIKIAGQPTLDNFLSGRLGAPLTICGIKVERSYETEPAKDFGWLALNVTDESGKPAAMRAGIYDKTGRSALPSEDAVVIKNFDDRTRNFLLKSYSVWPIENRFAFYIDGSYHIRLPAGRHRLIGSRGIEYQMTDEYLDIKPGQTLTKNLKLKRVFNMPKDGWYSGDVHIHSARRDTQDGIAVLMQTTAEDLHVGNLLEMGNVGNTYFPQSGWGKSAGRVQEGKHAVVSGQEDPRTALRGHTIHLNIDKPIRFKNEYLQYNKVFNEAARRGAVSGYAHVGYGWPDTLIGMALDVPFGLVNFAEIAQGGYVGTKTWFDFLNLGYRLAPAAGTDYPYLGHPGAYRSYVRMPDGYSIDNWFSGLKDGHTFVTNGPLIDVKINNHQMGEQVNISNDDVITVAASARLNPDIDRLDRLELISQGDVIATVKAEDGGATALRLDHKAVVSDSSWFVVRAIGKREGIGQITAVSAPIYVVVEGNELTWKRQQVPEIVSGLIAGLDTLKDLKFSGRATERWDTVPVWNKVWDKQISSINDQVVAAKIKLQRLADESQR